MKQLGILIDMGDTLIHNIDFNFKRSLTLMYEKSLNKNVTLDEFLNYSLKIINDVFSERHFIEIKLIDFLKQLMELFDFSYNISLDELEIDFSKNLSIIEIVDHSMDLLKYLKQKNYKIIVLSNTCMSKKAIINILKPFHTYLDDVIVSSDYCVRKPHFSFFDIGIKRLGLNKQNICFIGNDYYYDIYGSNLSGIKAIWFNEKHLAPDSKYQCQNYIEIDNYETIIKKELL